MNYNVKPYASYVIAGICPLTRTDLSDEITAALSGLAYAHPFFASYLYDRTNIVCLWPHDPAAQEIDRAATDGKNTYINAAYAASLTLHELMGVLAHEVSHDMLGHTDRMKVWTDWQFVPSADGSKQLAYEHDLMNRAMDGEINPTLIQSGLKLPGDCVFYPWIKPGQLTCEEIYEILLNEQNAKQKPKSKPGDGQGSGQPGGSSPSDDEGDSEADSQTDAGATSIPGQIQSDHGGFDKHIVPADQPHAADVEDRKRALKAAVANGKRAGNVPGHIEKLVNQLLKPVVDWREVLRDMLVKHVGIDQLDWKRMNKRRYLLVGVVDPARNSEHCGHIVFIFDTSGSVSDYVEQFLSEVAGVAEEMMPKAIHVLWTDTRVSHVDTLDDARAADVAALTIRGGGGTDLRSGFKWIDENLVQQSEEIAAVVVLTDSETEWPKEDPRYPVIVATTGPTLRHEPWMHVVEIDEQKARRAA